MSLPTTPNEESSTLSPVVSPAPEQVTGENETDSSTPPLHSGGKDSASSSKPDQDSSLLSNLKALSDEDFEQFLGDCEWQGTVSSLQQFEQATWEQDTNENESLSFPTLTSGDRPSPNVRPPGSTKCEQWFKKQGLIPNGSQLGTNAIATIMGFPSDWFEVLTKPSLSDATTASQTVPQEELEQGISQDEAAPQDKQPLSSEESSTWTPSLGNGGNHIKYSIPVESLDSMPDQPPSLEFHPLANIFPFMSKEDFVGLLEDMKANGYREDKPIWLYEGQILEGRNRYNAALQAGVTPTFTVV
jgi:hypothetical protein